MSAYEATPDHFIRWLEKDGQGCAGPQLERSFVSRETYGRYLRANLEASRHRAERGSCVRDVGTEVTDLRVDQSSVRLTLAEGGTCDVDCAVLCIGNFPPALPSGIWSDALDTSRYIANPWDSAAFDHIEMDDAVILVGSGLTMVDAVLELVSRGHRGGLTALSRRGFLPVSHADTEHYRPFLRTDRLPTTVLELFRDVRSEVAIAAERGLDWRCVIDAMRPQTQALWRNLPMEERRRFLRHVRPYWEVHRHRLAPDVAAEIAELQQSRRLSVMAGRISHIDVGDGSLTATVRRKCDGSVQHLTGGWIVNCSGPQLDYGHIRDPLIKALFKSGLARPDPLSLGLDVADDYRLMDEAGAASAFLFALGPPIRGSLWEATAVPDIRKQCEALARQLVGSDANG